MLTVVLSRAVLGQDIDARQAWDAGPAAAAGTDRRHDPGVPHRDRRHRPAARAGHRSRASRERRRSPIALAFVVGVPLMLWRAALPIRLVRAGPGRRRAGEAAGPRLADAVSPPRQGRVVAHVRHPAAGQHHRQHRRRHLQRHLPGRGVRRPPGCCRASRTSTPTSWCHSSSPASVRVVAAAITWPFTAVASALIYVDRRIRREGLDIELARAAGFTPPGQSIDPRHPAGGQPYGGRPTEPRGASLHRRTTGERRALAGAAA